MSTHAASHARVSVLIAGAGPVGLALAVELGHRGVSCLVVERNDRTGYSPRAKTTNVRTRTHLRRWGIAHELRAASPMPPDWPPNIVFATRMNGHVLARFENAFNGGRGANNLYPEEAQWVPQYTLEDVLRRHAVGLAGVEIRFNTELGAFTQDSHGVTASLRDVNGDQSTTIEADYLVGADGARSAVRAAIGAVMQGDGGDLRNTSVIFRAPELARRTTLGQAIMYWMVNAELPSVVGPMDRPDQPDGLWYLMATKLPDDGRGLEPAEMVRRATGLADLEVEIVGTDPWIARSMVADRYAKGRVFLAGDACHLHPPFGGFGMNMGISDAVDLGWKLAATLQGWGGAALLDSYGSERRPVHLRTIAEANANYGDASNQMVRPGLEDPGPLGDATRREVSELILGTKQREFRTLGLVLGTRYDGSPIIVDDGSAPPSENVMTYFPSACPGGLAPHLWLADGRSLYDLLGSGFSLLVTEGDALEAAPLVAAAEAMAMPLTLVLPGDDRLRGRYGARFALIRPDQIVAWRGDALPVDGGALLACVTGQPRRRLRAGDGRLAAR